MNYVIASRDLARCGEAIPTKRNANIVGDCFGTNILATTCLFPQTIQHISIALYCDGILIK